MVVGPLFSRRTGQLFLFGSCYASFVDREDAQPCMGLGRPSVGSMGLLYGVVCGVWCGCVWCVSTPNFDWPYLLHKNYFRKKKNGPGRRSNSPESVEFFEIYRCVSPQKTVHWSHLK